MAGFQLGSCGPKLVKGRSKCGDCLLATAVRTPNLSKNRCSRPRSSGNRGLSQFLSTARAATPGTTYTRSTPLALADVLQVLHNVGSPHALAPQRLVISWRLDTRRVALWSSVSFFASFLLLVDTVRYVTQVMQIRFQWKSWLAVDWSHIALALTSLDSVDFNDHNVWTPLLELRFHVHVGAFMEAHFD